MLKEKLLLSFCVLCNMQKSLISYRGILAVLLGVSDWRASNDPLESDGLTACWRGVKELRNGKGCHLTDPVL